MTMSPVDSFAPMVRAPEDSPCGFREEFHPGFAGGYFLHDFLGAVHRVRYYDQDLHLVRGIILVQEKADCLTQ